MTTDFVSSYSKITGICPPLLNRRALERAERLLLQANHGERLAYQTELHALIHLIMSVLLCVPRRRRQLGAQCECGGVGGQVDGPHAPHGDVDGVASQEDICMWVVTQNTVNFL
eukprot:6187171-Pleurochrysis_carterae.AAC.4